MNFNLSSQWISYECKFFIGYIVFLYSLLYGSMTTLKFNNVTSTTKSTTKPSHSKHETSHTSNRNSTNRSEQDKHWWSWNNALYFPLFPFWRINSRPLSRYLLTEQEEKQGKRRRCQKKRCLRKWVEKRKCDITYWSVITIVIFPISKPVLPSAALTTMYGSEYFHMYIFNTEECTESIFQPSHYI